MQAELADVKIKRALLVGDLLARCGGQRLRRQPLAPTAHHQLSALRAAVVIQRRLDPLLPLATPLRQRVAQPDPRAEIEDVIRPLPTVHYCKIDPKTNILIVQVHDTPEHRSLVSSEIKQVIMDISGYDVAHGFSKELKPSMAGK